MLSRLNQSTIGTYFKHLRFQMFHKIIHSIADVSLSDYIAHRSRYTRSSELKFIRPAADTAIDSHCLKYLSLLQWYIPSTWNS